MQTSKIISEAKEIQSWIVEKRRTIHRHPELMYEEFETSKLVQKTLSDLDITFEKDIAITGVVGIVGNGKGPCIALRADMDALPIHEETDIDFKSKIDGKMHACGHDCHTAMLLGAARLLKENEEEINGTIKLIFQPAEEGYGEQEWPNQDNQQIEMDYTCRVSDNFKQDVYLNENGTIEILLNFRIDAGGDCNASNAVCENLNLTFYKGGIELARQEFPAIDTDGNDDSLTWNINVDRNMTRFNRSGEEPQLRVEFSKPGTSGGIFTPCSVFYCGGFFRMYYHTPGNDSAEVEFPIINQTMPGGGDGDEGGLGAVSDALPGFGLMAGMSALAMAAVAGSRRVREN